jgi:hypothetical protein
MSNDATSVCLAAVAEAVEWSHVLENCLPKRTTQRVVIYPPSLSKLETVLVTGNIGLDMENGHDTAYQRILSACSKCECPPVFFPSDSHDFGGLLISEKVQVWMHTAAQVSIGGRKQVPENGADSCDSESDSENEDHTEVLSGMHTKDIPLDAKGQPIDPRYKLSVEQASALRAQAARLESESLRSATQASAAGTQMPTTHFPTLREEKLTPVNSEDEDQQRHARKAAKEVSQSTQK